MSEAVKKHALSGWGRYPVQECHEYRPEAWRSLAAALESGDQPHYIARGMGRSYGDTALNSGGGVITCTRLNRLIDFDEDTGVLTCEPGVTFAEIIDVFLPRGYFIPVTPGTKLLSVGGAIANDVHGKNHHRDGSFASAVLDFDLLTPVGDILKCSREDNADVFWATLGGVGLTGFLLTARFRLQKVESAYVKVDYLKTKDLDGVLAAITEGDDDYHYSMAWVDVLAKGKSLGRSVLMRGNHAAPGDLPSSHIDPYDPRLKKRPAVPFDFPQIALNSLSMKAFNRLYYLLASGAEGKIVDYNSYFFPLDAIGHWNRLYGKRGFVQYQVTVPLTERDGLVKILEASAKAGRSSFLAVLKKFGPGNEGLLSHPFEGFTLTLDIPVRKGLDEFLESLDKITLDHGGRLYLAKDAAMKPETFKAMYPKLEDFLEIRKRLDPKSLLSSSLARRLKIDQRGDA